MSKRTSFVTTSDEFKSTQINRGMPDVTPEAAGGSECIPSAATSFTATTAAWIPTPDGIDKRQVCRQLTESGSVPLSQLKTLLLSCE